MEKIVLESFYISGIKVRTNNKNEITSNAKIAPLWNEFFKQDILKEASSDEIYGAYFNYESDFKGDFDVMAGVKINDSDKYERLKIQSGEYLVFKAKGEMPQTVIDTWSKIWDYFSLNSKYKRRYGTDFEKYISQDEIEIYIGIL
ncbi:GyrI-like domain-containing protein [Aliarcobacter cryaerophilus]|uniref:GyrI-like domain-containing protein n=1 Tax=Aliarcobacter cryaerophilus TaxID=28198 RepID=UPI0021B2F03D|nr:GyrI-like domain-containing protein [Aliarcobacter cryaerophilus]MCT7527003.1 GyrI-like domain-containing protein [Aliarcobacter cryaerophilus]